MILLDYVVQVLRTPNSDSAPSRVLARAGLSHLKNLEPITPVLRYEHEAAGDLLRIDTKRLGRIVRPGHRVTGDRHGPLGRAGWEYPFVAIDDHARIGFTEMHPDEGKASAVQFVRNAVAYHKSLGVQIKRLLTDNGGTFRSKDFAQACAELNIKYCFTRPYRPQTNGKAERFIQSALREWAYAFVYQNSLQRNCTPRRLDSSLQRAPPSSGHRRYRSDDQTQNILQ